MRGDAHGLATHRGSLSVSRRLTRKVSRAGRRTTSHTLWLVDRRATAPALLLYSTKLCLSFCITSLSYFSVRTTSTSRPLVLVSFWWGCDGRRWRVVWTIRASLLSFSHIRLPRHAYSCQCRGLVSLFVPRSSAKASCWFPVDGVKSLCA